MENNEEREYLENESAKAIADNEAMIEAKFLEQREFWCKRVEEAKKQERERILRSAKEEPLFSGYGEIVGRQLTIEISEGEWQALKEGGK